MIKQGATPSIVRWLKVNWQKSLFFDLIGKLMIVKSPLKKFTVTAWRIKHQSWCVWCLLDIVLWCIIYLGWKNISYLLCFISANYSGINSGSMCNNNDTILWFLNEKSKLSNSRDLLSCLLCYLVRGRK